jgi:hypothetical protein
MCHSKLIEPVHKYSRQVKEGPLPAKSDIKKQEKPLGYGLWFLFYFED